MFGVLNFDVRKWHNIDVSFQSDLLVAVLRLRCFQKQLLRLIEIFV